MRSARMDNDIAYTLLPLYVNSIFSKVPGVQRKPTFSHENLFSFENEAESFWHMVNKMCQELQCVSGSGWKLNEVSDGFET